MDRLDDAKILEVFKESLAYHTPRRFNYHMDPPKPEFTLQDLVGKMLVYSQQITNQYPYDLNIESPNPEQFSVLTFSDGSLLLTEIWGDGECEHYHHHFYDGMRVRFRNSSVFAD